PVDPLLFETAVRIAVDATEALRVRFLSDGADGPHQIVGMPPDWRMSFVDVSGAADPRAAAELWMRSDLAEPVDLARGPFLTQALFEAAPDRFFWYSRYHHIVMDGFGFALIARRVAEVYTAIATGQSADVGTIGSFAALLEEEAAYRASSRFEQ